MNASNQNIRVMLVDDSAIIRGLVSKALLQDGGIDIVASANNGVNALTMLKNNPADVILLDIEMPEMDGITALPKLLEISPTSKVIMVSTLTQRNAEISLRAMELGATDYLAKPSSSRDDKDVIESFYRELIQKIRALAPMGKGKVTAKADTTTAKIAAVSTPVTLNASVMPALSVKALAIGSSTGGPQALNVVMGALKGKVTNLPIFITQHMPPTFTAILAEHISKACGMPAAEAKDGEYVKSGHVYVAPGNFHMVPVVDGANVMIRLNQDPPENFCRPAVDPMLRGLSAIYGKGLLTVILTGMGSDGALGCKVVHENGGTVVAQDEASCVVYGMPRAVAEAKVAKAILPLDQVGDYIIKACGVR